MSVSVDPREDLIDFGISRASHDRDRYRVVEVCADLAWRKTLVVLVRNRECTLLAASVCSRKLRHVERSTILGGKRSLDERHERMKALQTVDDFVTVRLPLSKEDGRNRETP